MVSVIIPVHNRQTTIAASVESALAQTYADLEIIVVDDGSTDGTLNSLREYEGRIRIFCQKNAGPSAARNRGVVESKGSIVAFLDSDDHWLPDKIARQVALMQKAGSGMCCCVCNATVKGADGVTIGNTFDFAGLRPTFAEGVWSNPQEVLATRFLLFNQVVAVRREAFERVGGFNESMRLLEDYELSLRLASAGQWGVIRDLLVIKHNDTNGIGVECMTDREKHAKVRAAFFEVAVNGRNGLDAAARRSLMRQMADAKLEGRALQLIKSDKTGFQLWGNALTAMLRIRRAYRRRLPSWPQFQGKPL